MRTLTEIIRGRNDAFDWLWAKQLRYQSELTGDGAASFLAVDELAQAQRIYATWTTGAAQDRERRQVAYDLELTREAQAAPRPWKRSGRPKQNEGVTV